MDNALKWFTLSHLTFLTILKYKILSKNTKHRLKKLLCVKSKDKAQFNLYFEIKYFNEGQNGPLSSFDARKNVTN